MFLWVVYYLVRIWSLKFDILYAKLTALRVMVFKVPGATISESFYTSGTSSCGCTATTTPEPSMGFGEYSSALMLRIKEKPVRCEGNE